MTDELFQKLPASLVADIYYSGAVVERDFSEGIKWYRKAAEQGHAQAQYNLGVLCERGEGVEKNLSEAFKCYLKAAKQGYAPSQFSLGLSYFDAKGVSQDRAEAVKWWISSVPSALIR